MDEVEDEKHFLLKRNQDVAIDEKYHEKKYSSFDKLESYGGQETLGEYHNVSSKERPRCMPPPPPK